jgi:AraC family transcriptional regulator of adaptative response/methylated-DNA-[protein]-cysteine methyltransferase
MPTRAIEFAIVPTSLGALLVAASEKGVCQVRFAEAGLDLEEALGREFPFAELRENPVRLEPWTDALVSYVDGHATDLELPLDVSGSRFERRVWTALRSIPRGETRTYSEVADSVGLPKGARAVARACASNPVAVAIPCHRVVPKRGGLGGYRWGPERKRTLLQREKTGRRESASASRGRGESPIAEVAAPSPVSVDSALSVPRPASL